VLLVDDEPMLLTALARELEDFADVTTAETVTAALQLVEERIFDIVVADLRLPDRWGDELLAHVAARAPHTRRFLLTADADPQSTVRELLEHGVIEQCFQKPWTQPLIEVIRQMAGPSTGSSPPPSRPGRDSSLPA
jgi:response regulator RpfG family c-di-GMP phosphodiesterase